MYYNGWKGVISCNRNDNSTRLSSRVLRDGACSINCQPATTQVDNTRQNTPKIKFKELPPKACKPQKELLLDRLKYHRDQGNEVTVQKMQRIIVKEDKKKWKDINSTFVKVRSLLASKVATKSEDERRVVHSNKLDVHSALKEYLDGRF